MKIRLFAILLAVVMVLPLVSCSSKTKSTSSAYSDDGSQTYEILWYYPGREGKDLAKINEKVNEYVKEKINATVKLIPLEWGVYGSKTVNSLNAGEKIDLMWQSNLNYMNNANSGTWIQIDDLFSKYAPKTKEMLGDTFLNGCKIERKLYGVPANKDKAHYIGLMYRKDIADKYGFDLSNVKSLKDMYPFFDKIISKDSNMVPYGIAGGRSPWAISMYDDLGGTGIVGFVPGEGENKIVDLYESNLFRQCCEQAQYMYRKGYIYKDAAVVDNLSELESNGTVFCWQESCTPGKLAEMNNVSKYKLGEIKLTDIVMNENDCLGSIMGIPYTCENPIRVMKFIELFNTDPYLNNLINFGIEGAQYEKISDNQIRMLDGKKDYDFVGSQWELGNMFINYTLENEDPEKFKKLKEFNESATPSKYLGFTFNREEVDTECSACSNVISEYKRTLEYGAGDVDTLLPQFINKLKKAGVDDVVVSAQKQYDKWIQNNE